ncbi:hypothetical protein CC86DRAFT_72589 [Ophiobolus disseminans]|uniref:Uncharacterized protein n=1 Tax=Ophiobolus disseminans TaxID=1469910 RepID=A0A6A6ZP10_9PLEO|nr:hypothetical protein CC86DRAFT_72589 [Ophiobolus disseminans]
MEFNQLQYVNKQLREETKGLVFQLNDLYFVAPNGGHGTNHAHECFQQCSPGNKKILRKLTIYFAHFEREDGLTSSRGIQDVLPTVNADSPLSRFRRENPQVHVIVRFSHLDMAWDTRWNWIGRHHIIQATMRGSSTWGQLSEAFYTSWTSRLSVPSAFADVVKLPNNLRFSLTQKFEITRAMLEGQVGSCGTTNLDQVVAEAKKMFDEGI